MTAGPILLFDVMDTLVHEPFFEQVPRFFDMSLGELLEAKNPAAWIDFEHGRIDEDTFFERFFKDGRAFDGPGLRAFMSQCYAWVEGMEDLLAELAAAGHPIHALSNYPIWYHMIDAKLALSRFLEWSFVSCDTGYRKPEPASYLHVVQVLGVDPARCLFIDDRQVNVEAARGVGMDAILCTDTPALRTELLARKVALSPAAPGGLA